ncbi:MAG: hypothetical protein WDW38_004425 [Sanguina aurantia]
MIARLALTSRFRVHPHADVCSYLDMLQLEERCQQIQEKHVSALQTAHAHKTFSSRTHVDPKVLQYITAELDKLLAHTPSLAQRQARWTRGDQLLSRLEAAVQQQLRCSDQLSSVSYNIHTDQINPMAISCEDFSKSAKQGVDLALLLSACRLAKLLVTPSDLSVCQGNSFRRSRVSSMQEASQLISKPGQETRYAQLEQSSMEAAQLLTLSGDFPPLFVGTAVLDDLDDLSTQMKVFLGLDLDTDSTANLLYLHLMLHTSHPFHVQCTGSPHIIGTLVG